MVDIPLPPRSHHKANKLIDYSALNKGLGNSKSDEECFTKIVSRDLQKKFQQPVYPVCPALRKWIKKEEDKRLPAMAQALEKAVRTTTISHTSLPRLSSLVKILIVFEGLIKLKPDFQTIVKCAHTENFLKGRLDLIRNDLSALPQSLEKDFPETSKECGKLIEELNIAELAYGGQTYVYIVPHGLEDGNWVTFGAWREQQINSTNFCDSAEMLTLTLHYPAEAIKVMYTLHKKLRPLAVKILPEQALAENQLSREIKGNSRMKQSKNGVEVEGSVLTMTVRSSKDNWDAIETEYDVSKKAFGKKINFVSDTFKRNVIFRDVEQAFVLASEGFSKPAVILAGGVIEELLRLYLKHKKIKPKGKRFVDYIKACEDNKLLKRGVSRLGDSIRDFRNLVHLEKEKEKRYTISKATAKGAVSSIFTIANDFQKVS